MAKINWVFQDEQGTNLNRYRATNVETGEEVVFDLLRGGNISVVGTPLNAEKLNSLISAINDLYDSKLDKTGGTLTGGLTINGATNGYSLNGSGYVKGSWLQSTTKKELTYNATMFVVYDNEGWLYYRSPSQVKSDIGLGNVDNTSDLNKPISSATQSALDLKATKEELKDYVKSTTLNSYVTTTTLDTRLGSYASISYLTNQLANYTTLTTVEAMLVDKVTNTQLENKLQDYAKTSDIPTIQKYYQHNIKITYNYIYVTFNFIDKSSSPYTSHIFLTTALSSFDSIDNLLMVSGINTDKSEIKYYGLYISTGTNLLQTTINLVYGANNKNSITNTSNYTLKDIVKEL